jgi:hypothetical protein
LWYYVLARLFFEVRIKISPLAVSESLSFAVSFFSRWDRAMSEVINLRGQRKVRLRAGDAVQAMANRLRFGNPLGERKISIALELRCMRDLDGRGIESGYES